MNSHTISALIAFILLSMGLISLFLGTLNMLDNKKSKAGIQMFLCCVCVFFWNFGYAWMSLCCNDSFAYIPRAIALLSITFYMIFITNYVGTITQFPQKRLHTVSCFLTILSLVAWVQIIQPNAVTFTMTPWGYWYFSQMSPARFLQFSCILAYTVLYYVILSYGRKHTTQKRALYVLNRFRWFGPIITLGYTFDTLIPTLFHTAAIPGSSIAAFLSSIILFHISQQNRMFGLSAANVSKYVFEDVHLPIIITDEQDKIALYNNSTPSYLGCTTTDLTGHYLDEFFRPNDTDILQVITTNSECRVEQTEIKDRFGDKLYTIYFCRDITKERQNFRMLEESRAIAEDANRAKTNFLANMSHEIRTPMNAITGMSEIILADSSVPPDILSKVNEIHIAGQNLLGIINDILDISKIEAGKYELIPDRYDLPSLIHDVSSIIGVRIQESNAAFYVRLDETLPKDLIGDVGRIRQILLNILGNAVKFIKKGSITFTVNWNHDQTHPQLFFDVADTGIGIKKENLQKIFGEFSQVDTRRNRNIQGTGLGLAISKHLAEMMGGTITVESEYGKGSIFHITILQDINSYTPIGQGIKLALENNRYHTALTKQNLDSVTYPDARILIVDDTKVNLMVARGLMKKYDMQLDTALSGKEAIEMVQKKDYDIVFMDHMMPEMDGVETTKHIRDLGGKYEALTIIALTANAISQAKDMFLNEGMQDFLAKPINARALDEILKRWLPRIKES